MVEEKNPTLVQVLAVFIIANFAPQLAIFSALAKPYFALDLVSGMVLEIAIMGWNVLLVLWVLSRWNRVSRPEMRSSLAWNIYGWRTVGWGAIGFITTLAVLLVVSLAFIPPFSYAKGGPVDLPFLLLFPLVSTHSLVVPLGEEVMFRGYVQTGIGRRYGKKEGLLVGALLFSLRHHPADLYWGAPLAQWVSRLLQLYIGALVFGWIRQRSGSTISTLIMHLLIIIFSYVIAFV